MMRLLIGALFGWLVLAGVSEAACSGSGLVWSCTAGSSFAIDVQGAYDSATSGAVITLDAGSYTSTGNGVQVTSSKGATFICATVRGCTVTVASSPVFWGLASADATALYRVSGFVFDGGGTAAPGGTGTIWFYAANGAPAVTWSQLRIDHNTFQNYDGSAVMIQCGGIDTPLRVSDCFGVVDHNLFSNSTQYTAIHYFSGLNTSPIASSSGTSDNLFVEDNQWDFTAEVGFGNGGCMDGWTHRYVIRFNTARNCHWAFHGVEHQAGGENLEFYGNSTTIDNTGASADGTWLYHAQGSGESLFFKNAWGQVTGNAHSANVLATQHYRDDASYGLADPPGVCDGTHTAAGSVYAGLPADGNRTPTGTYYGYPCLHQPGRDFAGVLKPIYTWGNYWIDDNSLVIHAHSGVGAGGAAHYVDNRDGYNAVSASAQSSATSPFDGTTGMGFGTLANRPTTCTPTSEAADAGQGGVGYWATDQGSWNTSTSNPYGVQQSGADGVLYRCSATNTWTNHYTPYTYPHPLNTGGGSSGPGRFTPGLNIKRADNGEIAMVNHE